MSVVNFCRLVRRPRRQDRDAKTAAASPLIKTTHVYKTVGDVKVEADVYRPEGTEARPVVVGILEAGFGDAVKVP